MPERTNQTNRKSGLMEQNIQQEGVQVIGAGQNFIPVIRMLEQWVSAGGLQTKCGSGIHFQMFVGRCLNKSRVLKKKKKSCTFYNLN